MLRNKETARRGTRSLQNSCSLSVFKKKITSSAQTENPNFFYIVNEGNYLKKNGEISENVQENYTNALNYLNEWNEIMNRFLENNGKTLRITEVPNFMSFFQTVFRNVERKTVGTQKNENIQPIRKVTSNIFGKELKPKSRGILSKNVEKSPNIFKSCGNILKNISKNEESSNSSVILSDEEALEEIKSFSLRKIDEGINPHPLNLNERDLSSRDRNFINSIGIFTENGELKQNAKNYLENKDDVKKGRFRNPRRTKFCTSIPTDGSDIKSD